MSFSRINEWFADMTTSLTVITSGVRNGTNATCITFEGSSEQCAMNSTIYFAGKLITITANKEENQQGNAVEPLNKGHLGTQAAVPYSEVCLCFYSIIDVFGALE